MRTSEHPGQGGGAAMRRLASPAVSDAQRPGRPVRVAPGLTRTGERSADDAPPGRVSGWIGGLVAVAAVLTIGFDPVRYLWQFGFPGMPLEFQSVSVSPSDLGLALLVAVGWWDRWRGPRRPLPGAARPVVAAGLVLLGCLTLSLIPAPARWLSAWKIGEVGLGLLAYDAVARRPWLARRLLLGGVTLVLFQLPQILVQEVAQSSVSLGSLLPGWPPVLPAPASGALVVFGPDGLRWQRAMGSFLHPNLLGGFLALALVLALPWLGRPTRYRPALWVVWTLGWVELLLTFSRAALLGAVLGCAVWLIAQRRRGVARAVAALVVATPAATALGAVVLLGNVLLPRITPGRALMASDPVVGRVQLIGIALRLIWMHPLLGVGAANFTLAELDPPFDGAIFQPVHVVPLLVAAEAGVLAGAAWLAVVLAGPIAAWRGRARDGGDWGERLAVPVAILVLAAFDHYLWSFAAGQALFWIVLGSWAARPECVPPAAAGQASGGSGGCGRRGWPSPSPWARAGVRWRAPRRRRSGTRR